MHAAIIFQPKKYSSLVYELWFVPNPCWHKHGKLLINPAEYENFNAGPSYQQGQFSLLLRNENLIKKCKSRFVGVVIHDFGHGTINDMKMLIKDINANDFYPQVSELI